jgi:glycosyltransferase involved in cell wall biosynthesis
MYIEKAGRGDDFVVDIANGYDPAGAAGDAGVEMATAPTAKGGNQVILHSGLLYAGERNPVPLLEALADVVKERPLLVEGVEFVFRGAGNEAEYREAAERLGVADVALFKPSVPYAQAKQEAAAADALMVLQGSVCNRQIPAKLYECAASGLPILCIADPQGDTATLARSIGIAGGARLEHAAEIKPVLVAFLEDLREGRATGVDPIVAEGMSRRSRTKELAACLDEVTGRSA